MCGGGEGMPGGIAGALRMAHAGLDHLNGPEAANLPAAGLGEALASLGALHARLTAAHAGLLRRSGACGAHDGGGYPATAAWLAAMTKVTLPGARAAVRQRRLPAACAAGKRKAQQPGPGGDGCGDRCVHLAATSGGAGVMRGDLTPGCAAAVRAVLDAPGGKTRPGRRPHRRPAVP
jgi:hypothetical protein